MKTMLMGQDAHAAALRFLSDENARRDLFRRPSDGGYHHHLNSGFERGIRNIGACSNS
jgi:hypothetical protein